jgi:cephalosporin hydroxylase
MVNQIIHNATITLQLPFDMSASAEVAALRAAGIPVDALGNATSGYLFVRTTGRNGNRTNTFRWFATSIGRAPLDVTTLQELRAQEQPSLF